MKYRRVAAVSAAAALTVLSATSAFADDVYNDLDGSIDVDHESMSLQYDDADSIPGPDGTTTMRVRVEDKGEGGDDFNNCNLPGNHTVTLVPAYNTGVVSVSIAGGGVIDACTDELLVTVTPVHSGTTAVTFSGLATGNPNAPFTAFDYSGADFDVTVMNTDLGDGNPGGGEICDADPAAPAWAAALLKGNGVKAKGKNAPNYVAMVAHEMGQGATFGSFAKSDHPEYEYAVWDYMKAELGLSLGKGPRHADVIKPGWECTTLPGSSS